MDKDAGDLLDPYNPSICPDEYRCIFFSATPQIVERAGVRIGLFALIEPRRAGDTIDPAVRRRIDEYKHRLRERLSSRQKNE